MALVNVLAPENWGALSGVYWRSSLEWGSSREELATYTDPYRTFTLADRYSSGYTMPDEEVSTGAGWQPYAWNYRFVFVLPTQAVVSEITATTAPVSGQTDPPRLHVVYDDGTRSQHDGTGNTNSFTPDNKAVDFFYFEGWEGYPQGSPFTLTALSINLEEPPNQLQVVGELTLVAEEQVDLQVAGVLSIVSGFCNELRVNGVIALRSELYNTLVINGVISLTGERIHSASLNGKLSLFGEVEVTVGAYLDVSGELRLINGEVASCWCGNV